MRVAILIMAAALLMGCEAREEGGGGGREEEVLEATPFPTNINPPVRGTEVGTTSVQPDPADRPGY